MQYDCGAFGQYEDNPRIWHFRQTPVGHLCPEELLELQVFAETPGFTRKYQSKLLHKPVNLIEELAAEGAKHPDEVRANIRSISAIEAVRMALWRPWRTIPFYSRSLLLSQFYAGRDVDTIAREFGVSRSHVTNVIMKGAALDAMVPGLERYGVLHQPWPLAA